MRANLLEPPTGNISNMQRCFTKSSTCLALGCVFVATFTVWSMYLMQMHIVRMSYSIAFLNHTVKDLDSFIRWKSQVNKEFMLSYVNSKIDPEIRHWYSFSKSEMEHLNKLPQDSNELIDHIRRHLLVKPPLVRPKLKPEDNSNGHAKKILQHFGNKTHGVFVECGASDGSLLSNTLWLETALNWTGLLIEPEPTYFKRLLNTKRHAWLMPACISHKNHPTMFFMHRPGANAENSENATKETNGVHCMPLFSILLAVNQTIDYFSLDIEGHELAVLKTVPFDKIDVKTWSIKHPVNLKEGNDLKKFMSSEGYDLMPADKKDENWAQEGFIFTKREMVGILRGGRPSAWSLEDKEG